MGVSADAPSLDSAYKLVEYGDRPVLKLSPGRSSLPNAKRVWRHFPIGPDVLAIRDEAGPIGFEPLLVPVVPGGRRVDSPDSIEAARIRLSRDLAGLPAAGRDLHEPVAPRVELSESLRVLAGQARASAPRG